ncbi:MAG: hypothetical protein ACR2PS_03200 [Pseudomonadales bacterium]
MIDSIEHQKHAKKTEYLYAQVPNIGMGNIIAGCLLVAIYWTELNHSVLIGWLMAVFALTAHRFYAARAFRSRDRYANIGVWYKLYANSVIVSGCLWGAVGIFIAHQSSAQQLPYFLMILGALVACASISNNAFFSMYKRFAIPAMIPLGIYLITQFSSDKSMMGLLVLCWFALMYSTASRFNQFVSTSLGFEFENIALLRQLEAGNARIRELKKNNMLQEKSIKNLQNSDVKKNSRYAPGSRLATVQEKSKLRIAQ